MAAAGLHLRRVGRKLAWRFGQQMFVFMTGKAELSIA